MRKNYKNIARQIHAMAVLDQKVMVKAKQSGSWDEFSGITKKNSDKLKAIIKKYGWPTISLVGKRSNRGAWLIVQHADHDVEFQEKCLKLMQKIWAENPNDIAVTNLAFLKDRTLVNRGKKQLFGTQFYLNKKCKMVPKPIKDPKGLERIRAKYGLPPFKDYLESAKKYKPVK